MASYPASNLGLGQRLFQFGVLAASCTEQVRHAYRLVCVGGEEGGVERDVANIPARDGETGEARDVQPLPRRAGRGDAPPDLRPLRRVPGPALDDGADTTQAGTIHGGIHVR